MNNKRFPKHHKLYKINERQVCGCFTQTQQNKALERGRRLPAAAYIQWVTLTLDLAFR